MTAASPAPVLTACNAAHGDLTVRQGALDHFLIDSAALWRPMPFRLEHPEWMDTHPALGAVDRLGDDEVGVLRDDPSRLRQWLVARASGLGDLHDMTTVPRADTPAVPYGERAARGVRGRKRAQVEAFAGALGRVRGEALEWCSGKGHLGRLLALAEGCAVTSLERDASLCREGEALALKAGARQRFVCEDAMSPEAGRLAAGRHALALHACGDLHRTLADVAIAQAAVAADIAPCCYHLSAQAEYRPMNPRARLRLTRDELRLAVTETVTAGARDQRLRDRDAAWKHAFVLLRADALGGGYAPFPPVPAAWLRGSFEDFITCMAARHDIHLPSARVTAGYEARGWRRLAVVSRRELVRLAFRRVLELWLVTDLGSRFEAQGYHCALRAFCDARLTPRNLLLSARLPD